MKLSSGGGMGSANMNHNIPTLYPPRKRPLILVPCSSQKAEERCQSQDLYTSQYFKSCRAYAEAYAYKWFILSAKYGIIAPDQQIDPYDLKLSSLSAPEIANWALKIFDNIRRIRHARDCSIIIVGGAIYRKRLVPYLRGYGYDVSVPFEGLGIGEQIQTMNNLASIKMTT